MTSGGPEPGWMLDPDDFGRERYWNGRAWTEHRRLIAMTVSPPADNPPTDAPKSFVSFANAVPGVDRESGPPITETQVAGYPEWSGPQPHGTPQAVIESTRGPWVVRASMTPGTRLPDPRSGTTDIRPGDTVKVVAGHRQWLGKIGTVKRLAKRADEDRVVVKFEDSSFEYFYRIGEVELVRS